MSATMPQPRSPMAAMSTIVLLAVASLVLGVLMLIATALVVRDIPLPKDFLLELLPENVMAFHPEWDTFLYRLFVFLVIDLQAAGLLIFRSRLTEPRFIGSLRRFVLVESGFLFLLCFYIFKSVVYPEAQAVLNPWICRTVIAALLTALLWRWADRGVQRCAEFFFNERYRPKAAFFADVLAAGIIFLALFIPDLDGTMARIFAGDHAYHFESFAVAPAWVYAHGGLPGVDTFSQYGLGLPIFIATFTGWLGKFSYENILGVLITLSIIYYLLFYSFLRWWLGSSWLALMGVVFSLKYLVFYDEGVNFIWSAPSGSPMRFLFDIPFFICLLAWFRLKQRRYLFLAMAAAGAGMFYINDTGIYLLASAYAFLLSLFLNPEDRRWITAPGKGRVIYAGTFIIPWLTWGTLILCFYGAKAGQLFNNQAAIEYIKFTTTGLDSINFFVGYKTRWFFALSIGIIMAVVYVLTLLVVLSGRYCRKLPAQDLLGAAAGIYGLCLYNYFIFRSSPVAHHFAATPFALVICFWIYKLTEDWPYPRKQKVFLALAGFTVFCLVSSHAFMRYPNLLNLSRQDFKEALVEEKRLLDISEDVSFIRSMTSPAEKVCLFSAFEAPLLMGADRRPFFYYFPLMTSRELQMRDFGGSKLVTVTQLRRVIAQIEREKPRYVFVERKFVNGQLPVVYFQHYQALREILVYLKQHYSISREGKYLVALQRAP